MWQGMLSRHGGGSGAGAKSLLQCLQAFEVCSVQEGIILSCSGMRWRCGFHWINCAPLFEWGWRACSKLHWSRSYVKCRRTGGAHFACTRGWQL